MVEKNERKVPDLSFGTGAPSDLLGKPENKSETNSGERAQRDRDEIDKLLDEYGIGKSDSAGGEKKPVTRKRPAAASSGTAAQRKKRVKKPAPVKSAETSETVSRAEEKPVIKAETQHSSEAEKAVSVIETYSDQETFDTPEREPVRRSGPARRPANRSGSSSRKKKKKKRERILNTSIITGLTITIVVISASIVLSTGAITLGMEYLGINKSDKVITFNIPQGADSDEIADLLIENNIIKNKDLFKLALRFADDPVLYPGDITLSPNKSYPDIIDKIGEQRELYETVTLTFKEGTNLRAVGAKLEKNGVCTQEDFLFQFNNDLGLPLDGKLIHSADVYYPMEGYFFPDTYEFYVNDSAYNVSKTIRENYDRKITTEMYSRMNEIGMDLNQVMTLASIVQWEAGTVEDMPIVASVFLNRLAKPEEFPQLQSDATKNYITNVIEKVETSSAIIDHYRNLYDTYVCFGLPAGPICNPGLDAINAVLYPEETNYYYFCNNLETGEAFYAETYKEHRKNLKKAGLSE